MTRLSRVLSTSPGSRAQAFGPADWGLLATAALIWGFSFVFIAEGVEVFAPPVVAWGRLVLGALALSLAPASRRPIDRADWPRVIVLSLVWMAIPLLLFPVAQQWVTSGVAGMINGAVPLFAGLMAAAFLRRRPGLPQTAGLVVGFAGVVMVSWPAASGESGSPLGVALILLAVLCYGLAVNLAVPLQHRYGALPPLLRSQLVSIVIVTPFFIAGLPSSSWAWSSAAAVLLLGVLGTGVAYVAMAVLVGRVGATRGSIATYFIPVVAVVLGALLRDERFHPVCLAGMALVLAGAWLTSRSEK
jgi:drug/metabolite transporter (DMT)-like permease